MIILKLFILVEKSRSDSFLHKQKVQKVLWI